MALEVGKVDSPLGSGALNRILTLAEPQFPHSYDWRKQCLARRSHVRSKCPAPSWACGGRSVNLVLSLVLTAPHPRSPDSRLFNQIENQPGGGTMVQGHSCLHKLRENEGEARTQGAQAPHLLVCGLRRIDPEVPEALPPGYPPNATQGERRLCSQPPYVLGP